ncbi:MAG: winged helix-turn-helix domain-containing protein [Acidimicrobiia bacterium]|nr:winged helix-turn-helix domain-containing protein [Acidimicrobiia bacterium]
MTALPGGTVTLLFADIEGSVDRWERDPDGMRDRVGEFQRLAGHAVAGGGVVVKSTGDGLVAAFRTATSAVESALKLQQDLTRRSSPLAVRMGIHSGTAEPAGGDYVGRTPNLAARVMGAASGGQVLLSGAAADLVRRDLPDACGLVHLGDVALKGIAEPEPLWALTHPDLPVPDARPVVAGPDRGSPRYRFGANLLDPDGRELLHDGQPVDMEPRTFAVLTYLVRHRDRVVTKEELLDEVWGDHFVSESALTTRIKHARAAVGDDGRSQGRSGPCTGSGTGSWPA